MTSTGSRAETARSTAESRAEQSSTAPGREAATTRPRAPLGELGAIGAGAAVLVALLLRPFPLDVPTVYGYDSFLHQLLARSADWSGSLGSTARLAAPHGLDWSVYPTAERLHVVVLHALGEITDSYVAAVNLHAWMSIVATAIVAHAVLRWLRLGPVVAGAAALLFSVSPSALQRLAPGHLFLFALFPVALGVYLLVWSVERPPPSPAAGTRNLRSTTRTWAPPLLASLVIALSSVYYAIFTAVLLVGVGAIAATRHRNAGRLVAPILVATAVVTFSGLSLAPDLLDRRDDPSAAAVERGVAHSETYGLRPAQMLLPRPDHPVEPMARLGQRARETNAPGDDGAVIGLLGVAGLLVMGVAVARSTLVDRGGDDPQPVGGGDTRRTTLVLAATTTVALAFAAAGGGGLLLATFGMTQVRTWSRLVAFVMFTALAALGLVSQRRHGRSPRFRVAVGVVAVLAFVDQGVWTPSWSVNEQRHREDRELVAALADLRDGEVVVAQLPVMPYPDQVGHARMLAPAVLGDDRLRFSGGAFSGGAGDWQRSWLAGDGEVAARAAAAAGMDVILVLRDHEQALDVADLESTLARATGVEGQSTSRGSWVWYDLRPLRDRLIAEHSAPSVERVGREVVRPIGVSAREVVRVELERGVLVQSFGPSGSILLHGDGSTAPLDLELDLEAQPGSRVRIDAPGARRSVVVDDTGRAHLSVELEVHGDVALKVFAEGEQIGSGSSGPVHLRLAKVIVRDLAAGRSPVLFAPLGAPA